VTGGVGVDLRWALAVVGGLGVLLVIWMVRSELRERRKARYLRQLSAQYRKQPRAFPAEEPPQQKITVEELVARIESEGLLVRLRWNDEDVGQR